VKNELENGTVRDGRHLRKQGLKGVVEITFLGVGAVSGHMDGRDETNLREEGYFRAGNAEYHGTVCA